MMARGVLQGFLLAAILSYLFHWFALDFPAARRFEQPLVAWCARFFSDWPSQHPRNADVLIDDATLKNVPYTSPIDRGLADIGATFALSYAAYAPGKKSSLIKNNEYFQNIDDALNHQERYTENEVATAKQIQELRKLNKYYEEERVLKSFIFYLEKKYGTYDENIPYMLDELATVYNNTGRYAESLPIFRKTLEVEEKIKGHYSRDIAIDYNNLGHAYRLTGHYSEALNALKEAANILLKVSGSNDFLLGIIYGQIGGIYQSSGRYSYAETFLKQAVLSAENSSKDNIGEALLGLAKLYDMRDKYDDAEKLYYKALKYLAEYFGLVSTNTVSTLELIANHYIKIGKDKTAEGIVQQALDIQARIDYGAKYTSLRLVLANIYQNTGRITQAESIYLEEIQNREKAIGAENPSLASDLRALASLYVKASRYSEAEPLLLRALTILQKSYGPVNPDVAATLDALAHLQSKKGDKGEALKYSRKATAAIVSHATAVGNSAQEERYAYNTVGRHADYFRHHLTYLTEFKRIASIDSRGPVDEEAFEVAQWADLSLASEAVEQMSERFASNNDALASLVRKRQDLVSYRRELDKALTDMLTKSDSEKTKHLIENVRKQLADANRDLYLVSTEIKSSFSEFFALAAPTPLGLKETQNLLRENEAFLFFLSSDLETHVFAITPHKLSWRTVGLSAKTLRERVSALRCGLDSTNWQLGEEGEKACEALLGSKSSLDQLPPFDTAASYQLYLDLLGDVEDLIKDKSLLIVPSGALTQLPFEVLVTAKPDDTLPRFEAFKTAAWLGQWQAITILPSVGSLKALRTAKGSAAKKAFIGFGNPLLDGRIGKDKSAWAKQTCTKPSGEQRTRTAGRAADVAALLRDGQVNVESLRHQPPLPETADELCAVAKALGVPEARLDDAVYLGKRATVSQLKALSKSGELARARMVHFATHGLLAGQTAMFAKNKAEPALLLTPPAEASEEDNGLLTASEVAQLNLNADWVVMSACNTAAGSNEGAEALSGLARAFFYAGARSLLVSHWAVDSEAAVAITTGAVNAMKVEPKIGRAEALRQAEVALIAKGGDNAHPSVWAPFVLVGNGEQ